MRPHCEGETRAHAVWHESCVLVHDIRQDELAVALLVVVAELVGEVPGTTQEAWQLAKAELQFNMQFVVVELCAKRIVPPAFAPTAKPPIAITANRTLNPRMYPRISPPPAPHHDGSA